MGMMKNILHVTLFIVLFMTILPTKCQEDRKENTESIVAETSTSTTIFNDLLAGETGFLGEQGVVEISKSVTIVNIENVNTERAEVMKDFIQTTRTTEDFTTVRTIITNLEIENTNYVDLESINTKLLDNNTPTVTEIHDEMQNNTTEKTETANEAKNFNADDLNEENLVVTYDEIYEESSSKDNSSSSNSNKELINLNSDEVIPESLMNNDSKSYVRKDINQFTVLQNMATDLTATENINKFEENLENEAISREDNEKDQEEDTKDSMGQDVSKEENVSIIPKIKIEESTNGNEEEHKDITQEVNLSINSEATIQDNSTENEELNKEKSKDEEQEENYKENEEYEKNQDKEIIQKEIKENQTEIQEIIGTTNLIMTTEKLIGENQEIKRTEQQNQDIIDEVLDQEENTSSNPVTVADETKDNEDVNKQAIREENEETNPENTSFATVADKTEYHEDENNQEISEKDDETNKDNEETNPKTVETLENDENNQEDDERKIENENITTNYGTAEAEGIRETTEENTLKPFERTSEASTTATDKNEEIFGKKEEPNLPENQEILEKNDRDRENSKDNIDVNQEEYIIDLNEKYAEEVKSIDDLFAEDAVYISTEDEFQKDRLLTTEQNESTESLNVEIVASTEFLEKEYEETSTFSTSDEEATDLVIRIIFPKIENTFSKQQIELSTQIGRTTVIENQSEINNQNTINEENGIDNVVESTTYLENINSAEFDEIETTSHLDDTSETTTTIIDIWLAEKNKTKNITEEILTTTEDVTLGTEPVDITSDFFLNNLQEESFETSTAFTERLTSSETFKSVDDNEQTTNNVIGNYITSTMQTNLIIDSTLFTNQATAFQESTDHVTDAPQIESITSAEDATGSTIFSKEMVDNGQFTADAINILKEDTTENINIAEENLKLYIDTTTNEDILTFEVTSSVSVLDTTVTTINEGNAEHEYLEVNRYHGENFGKNEPNLPENQKILEKNDRDRENSKDNIDVNQEEYIIDLNEEYAEEVKSIDDLFAEYAVYTSTEDQFQKDTVLTTDSVISSMKELEELENLNKVITPNEISEYVTTSTNIFETEDYKDISTESKESIPFIATYNNEKELFSKHVFKTYIDRTTTTEKTHNLENLSTVKIDEDILKEELTNAVEHLLIDRDLRKNSSADDKKNWQIINLNELVEETEDNVDENDQDEYIENKRKLEKIADNDEEVDKIKMLEKELAHGKYDVSYLDPSSTNYYDEDYTSSEGFNSTESIYTDNQVNSIPYISIGQNTGNENCLQGNISLRIFIGEHSLQAPENSTIYITCSHQTYYLKVSWRSEEHENLNNTVSLVIESENNTYFIESVEVIHDDNIEITKSSKRQLRILETIMKDAMIGSNIIDFENGYQLELVDVNLIPKKLIDYSGPETASQAKPIFDKITIIIISTSAGVCGFVLLVVGVILYKKLSSKTTIYKMTIE